MSSFFCGALSCFTCFAETPAPATSQSASPAPATSPAPSAKAPTAAKKTSKVWTNDDVNGLSGPVSVVGNSKNLGKGGPDSKAHGQYIQNTRKELRELQSQLDDTNKQLSDLKNFSEGKAPATSSGDPINTGYNRVPVDRQITGLEDKRKQLRARSMSWWMRHERRVWSRATFVNGDGVLGSSRPSSSQVL